MTDQTLTRFISAQGSVLEQVEAELAAGHKKSHWMWFVFPQLAGLGHSETARHYAIDGLAEARRYLDDPLLGDRLRKHVGMMLRHKNTTARAILGAPDDLKFRSCLTLFAEAAPTPEDAQPFLEGLRQFYDGRPDVHTLDLLRSRR